MAEWLKAAVLKTVVGKLTRGSNPCSSASFFLERWQSGRMHILAKDATGQLVRGFESLSLRH